MDSQRKRVVIVGGGFGGLYAAKALAGKPVEVTLVDRKNHHTFQPLLYQVATAVLSPGEIAEPLRRILRAAPNVEVILGEVLGFDLAARRVKLNQGEELAYDYLIVAAGARHAYFGHDDWAGDAPGLKTIEDALEIRRRVLLAFEIAERQASLTGRHEPLRFAVVGGGPTGVELAGAIADIARRAMKSDFKAIDTAEARVTIYEGASRVLGAYPEALSRKAEKQLEELGVELRLNSLVSDLGPGRIKVGDEWIPASVIVWATGVAASPLGKALGAPTDRAGRVLVTPDLSLPGNPNVFVIGDLAWLKDADGVEVPGLGAAATQEGTATAANIVRDLRGEPRRPYKYWDKGSMATIGRNRAVALIGGRQVSGILAWLLWALVHIFLLIGFRNRLAVMREWMWAYFTRERSARLITDLADEKESKKS
ncbi:MAG TPA: NAD(P)/FAD-dependent oxidoreductase [Thermoanaerobaculia bacterium]|jgi:NADH dehydrogenase